MFLTVVGAGAGSEALKTEAAGYHGRLCRAARGMGFAPADAEDVVQEVFATFVSTLDRFERRSSVHTWLFGILIRKAQERRRASARDERHDPIDEEWQARFDAAGSWIRPPVDPGRALEGKQLAAAIADCLPDLTPAQRDVLMLRTVEELPAAEVSKILDTTVTHTGVLLHRARLRMRKCLGMKGWTVNTP